VGHVDEAWHVYSMGRWTQLLGSGILNFGPCASAAHSHPKLNPVGKDDTPKPGCFLLLVLLESVHNCNCNLNINFVVCSHNMVVYQQKDTAFLAEHHYKLFHTIFSPHCSLAIWLGCEESSSIILAAVFPTGLSYARGVEKLRFSTSTSLYLGNDTRYV